MNGLPRYTMPPKKLRNKVISPIRCTQETRDKVHALFKSMDMSAGDFMEWVADYPDEIAALRLETFISDIDYQD